MMFENHSTIVHRLASQSRIILGAALAGAMFLTPARLATAVDPGTFAAMTSFASTTISLFESGADPTGKQIDNIYHFTKALHERLNAYDKAFDGVLRKLDDMPPTIIEEFERISNELKRQEVRAAIRLILEDIQSMTNTGSVIANAQSRLDNLQEKSRELLESKEDLNMPYMVSAMRVERAFIMAQNLSPETRGGDWRVREASYIERLDKILDPERRDSLISRMELLKNATDEKISSIDEMYLSLNQHVKRTEHPASFPQMVLRCHTEQFVHGVMVTEDNEVARKLAQDLDTLESEVTLNEEMFDLYRYMVDYTRYIIDTMSGRSEVVPAVSTERRRSALFLEMEHKIRRYADRFPSTWFESRGRDIGFGAGNEGCEPFGIPGVGIPGV